MDEKGAGTAGWQSSSSLRIYRLLCVVKKKKIFASEQVYFTNCAVTNSEETNSVYIRGTQAGRTSLCAILKVIRTL